MKVYIVTSGEYSDYRINAVFSTKEKAEDYLAAEPSNVETPEIEEYEMDMPPSEWWTTIVYMLRDGTVKNHQTSLKRKDEEAGFLFLKSVPIYYPAIVELAWVVVTKDVDRAIKVVNEKRTQIIALGLWPEPFPTSEKEVANLAERIKELVK